MTTNKELRKLAEKSNEAEAGTLHTHCYEGKCAKCDANGGFQTAANPTRVLALLDEVDRLGNDANHLHYLWGVTLGRFELVRDVVTQAGEKLDDYWANCRDDHSEAKP